jgi:hypothetical protein
MRFAINCWRVTRSSRNSCSVSVVGILKDGSPATGLDTVNNFSGRLPRDSGDSRAVAMCGTVAVPGDLRGSGRRPDRGSVAGTALVASIHGVGIRVGALSGAIARANPIDWIDGGDRERSQPRMRPDVGDPHPNPTAADGLRRCVCGADAATTRRHRGPPSAFLGRPRAYSHPCALGSGWFHCTTREDYRRSIVRSPRDSSRSGFTSARYLSFPR